MIAFELTEVINTEIEALKKILNLLDLQYKNIMEKNIFELDGIVDKMKILNKELAEAEVERRKLVGDKSIKEIIKSTKYEELDKSYRNINSLLHTIKLQKDTNELLIRQQMGFNNQMLNILNPRRETKIYNSYGNLSR